MKKKSFYFGLLAACLLTPIAPAHSVWVEPGPEGALVVRFGELDGDVEKSPGYLDSLATPVGTILPVTAETKTLESEKKSDHYTLGGAKPDQALVAESTFPVMGAEGKPARRPIFYSRWLPADGDKVAGQPSLTLDIVPSGNPGEVRVYFRGTPLPGAKAQLNAPDGSHTPLKTDDDGLVKFTCDEPGRWVLTVPGYSE
ncbi:MAG: cobalt transporter substrate-binding protein, partial [Akkermansiaceae bacterium]|nr:cobalt transporter substrate-binding protein [Akkermansiaceae bacterium]